MTAGSWPAVETVREARLSALADLLAIKPHLEQPYPDDPRWTPWTRFGERAYERIGHTKDALARLEAVCESAARCRYAPSAGDGDVLVAREDWDALREALDRVREPAA